MQECSTGDKECLCGNTNDDVFALNAPVCSSFTCGPRIRETFYGLPSADFKTFGYTYNLGTLGDSLKDSSSSDTVATASPTTPADTSTITSDTTTTSSTGIPEMMIIVDPPNGIASTIGEIKSEN